MARACNSRAFQKLPLSAYAAASVVRQPHFFPSVNWQALPAFSTALCPSRYFSSGQVACNQARLL